MRKIHFALVSRRQVMFGQSTNVRQIERRLRSLEQRVKGAGDRTSASAAEAAERVANAVGPLLNRVANQFREGADSMSDETAKLGNEVVELGNDALRRLSNEAKHRPFAAVAVAFGVGIVLALASRRSSGAVRAPRAMRSPRRRAA
jgi:hypothetical protein